MSPWQVVTGLNLVIAGAYLAIAAIVLGGLGRTRQLPSNRLGLATGLIFLTCAAHHAAHAVHLLLPSLGVDDPTALALRAGWPWPNAALDLMTAVVAAAYLSLRGRDGRPAADAGMFADVRARERQALEINDNLVQGLARVKWALEAKRADEAHAAADETLAEAQRMVTDLLESTAADGTPAIGRLRRDAPAGATPSPA